MTMTDSEYRALMDYIYHEYIERELVLPIRGLHRRHFLEERDYYLDRLMKSTYALRFIEDYFHEGVELQQFLTGQMLDAILTGIESGANENNRLVVATGIADVIQEHFEVIVDGMQVDHLPKEDFEVLRRSGSPDPRREATLTMYRLKSRKEQLLRDAQEVRFSRRLEQVPDLIARRRALLQKALQSQEQNNKPEQAVVKRKIFKGLGAISQGTLLSITNVSLAAGFWAIPLPPETTTVGVVASITSGIGSILTGVGELRGE